MRKLHITLTGLSLLAIPIVGGLVLYVLGGYSIGWIVREEGPYALWELLAAGVTALWLGILMVLLLALVGGLVVLGGITISRWVWDRWEFLERGK